MAMSGSSPNHSPKPAVSSPWSQIVSAAAAAEEPVAITESLDNGKRSAWNKPSNEGSSSELNPFMAAESWPALSESTRASAKSPSPSSSSSVPSSQGTGSVLHSPQRQVRDNVSTNDMVPAHQKPFKRSYSNPSSNGGHPPQLSVPQGSMASTGSHSHNSSFKEHQPRTGFVSNDHQHQRYSYRNRNGGSHQRGDGAHHHNYGGRRDQDRGNHEWNTNRNFNGRDNYMSPRFGPRFSRPPPPPPPPNSAYFFQSPLMWPSSGPIGFLEQQPQMVYGVPPPPPPPLLDARRAVVPVVLYPPPIPPHSMLFPSLDPQLHSMILNQIDYYFSDENLVKDVYLRRNMDDQGWVPINLIADFKKVKQLTDNVHIVLYAVGTSSTVEVQGDKIRRRNDWNKWILPLVQSPNFTGSQTIGKLADQVQNIALETTNNDGVGGLDVSQNRPNGDLNSQFLRSSSEGTGQVHTQVSDHSISAWN